MFLPDPLADPKQIHEQTRQYQVGLGAQRVGQRVTREMP